MKHGLAALAILLLAGAVAFGQQSEPSAMSTNTPMSVGTTGMTAETSGPVVDELKKLEDDWAKAALTKDATVMGRIEGADYQFVMPDGKMRGKQEDIASLKDSNYTEFANSDMNVRVYGDTALVTGLAHIKGTEAGKDMSGDYRFTDVFIKRDGKWEAVNTVATKATP